uniref:J domain-containing protein n=1 Tax=Graphocephala atropunctata TaxID=36148 RepID=A0A1B6LC45_9HEMI
MVMGLFRSFLLLSLLGAVLGWGGDELEVFDVVEEVNQNFYTLLGVPQDADGAAIKKAFRKLSLVLHPDKSDAPDAEVQFRNLVAVYDVLKDAGKRKCYDNVLENGLPDWKQAVYYYRRVRKMGLREMAVILFVIITIGQYLVGWANYFERKLTVDEFLNAKNKKSQKKQKKGKADPTLTVEEFEAVLVKPRSAE